MEKKKDETVEAEIEALKRRVKELEAELQARDQESADNEGNTIPVG